MARDQERIKAYKKARRAMLKEQGLCLHCEKVKTDSCLCDGCRQKQRDRQDKHREQGVCSCGRPAREGAKTCINCYKPRIRKTSKQTSE